MSARFVPTLEGHVLHVASHMRECDRMEVWASSHQTPIEALRESVAITDAPETIMVHDVPAAICGVAKYATGIGVPWMLGTGGVESAPVAFGRICREWIARKRAEWPFLVNYSDARCEKTHRWLEWLGFRLFEPTPFGVEGLMFRRFEMENRRV